MALGSGELVDRLAGDPGQRGGGRGRGAAPQARVGGEADRVVVCGEEGAESVDRLGRRRLLGDGGQREPAQGLAQLPGLRQVARAHRPLGEPLRANQSARRSGVAIRSTGSGLKLRPRVASRFSHVAPQSKRKARRSSSAGMRKA